MNKKELSADNFIKRFFIFSAILLCLTAGIVVLFDPFFHYHKPLGSLKAVLTEKEYQVPGSLDNFDYDAVIAGSSVAENNNNRWFDETFDCTSIKAIRSYGATADLCYFIKRAMNHHQLKFVFLNLDPSALVADINTSFEETGSPMYLYDNNPVNDVKYFWNKDVLFNRIPYMIANSFIGDYDEGTSYNWAQWKDFDEETALYHYYRRNIINPVKPEDSYIDLSKANTALIEELIISSPDTEFYIFVPPYSILWWDTVNRDGDVPAYIKAEEYALKKLLTYSNVNLYNFQNAEDIVFNLEYYLDSLHFCPEINEYICESLKNEQYKLRDDSEIESSLENVLKYASESSDYVDGKYGDRINVAY